MEASDASSSTQIDLPKEQEQQQEQSKVAEDSKPAEGVKLRYARCMCGQFQIELIGE